MASANQPRVSVDAVNPWTATDVAAILRERGWLTTDPTPEVDAWCAHAAAILGAHAADRAVLAELLALIFHYDAQEILARVQTHEVLAQTPQVFATKLLKEAFARAQSDGVNASDEAGLV